MGNNELKIGATDGIRTRDSWNHNPVLYQLSYDRHELINLTEKHLSVNEKII
jgi:hypothetical protein